MSNNEDLKKAVKEGYGKAALKVEEDETACCGTACCSEVTSEETKDGTAACTDPITRSLYGEEETAGLPETAVKASLGCGNPTALATLREGETVIDLGSGGGIDVLLSARRVGPTGKAYGLDMTDEMLALARENQRRAGVSNVEFLKGEIDVVISNCVINLSEDKDRALREAFRVLKASGRFAVSDVVVRGPLSPAIRKSVELYVGCIAGALEETEYLGKLEAAGFVDVDVTPTRVYGLDDAREILAAAGLDAKDAAEADGKVMSAFVRGRKPA